MKGSKARWIGMGCIFALVVLFSGLPQAMAGWAWETDSRGVYVFCSAEVESLLGLPPQEMLGTALDVILKGIQA